MAQEVGMQGRVSDEGFSVSYFKNKQAEISVQVGVFWAGFAKFAVLQGGRMVGEQGPAGLEWNRT